MPTVNQLSNGKTVIDFDPLPSGRRDRAELTKAAELGRVGLILTGTDESGDTGSRTRVAMTPDDAVALAEHLLRHARRARPRS